MVRSFSSKLASPAPRGQRQPAHDDQRQRARFRNGVWGKSDVVQKKAGIRGVKNRGKLQFPCLPGKFGYIRAIYVVRLARRRLACRKQNRREAISRERNRKAVATPKLPCLELQRFGVCRHGARLGDGGIVENREVIGIITCLKHYRVISINYAWVYALPLSGKDVNTCFSKRVVVLQNRCHWEAAD